MKIALLADIHSNFVAFKACLDYIDADKFDGIAFLGDYVSDCPYPQRTLELVRGAMARYRTWFIRGNREEYLIGHHYNKNDGWNYSSSSGSLLYTYENITQEDIGFFEGMPIFMKVEIDGCRPFALCHGSPQGLREALFADRENSRKYLEESDCDYLFCAHTHRPFRYEYRNKLLINCGSVGACVIGQPVAQFTEIVYEQDEWKESVVTLKYDVDTIVEDFYKSGLIDKGRYWSKAMIMLLKIGRDYPYECIKRAIWLARQDGAEIRPHALPEVYWERAAIEMGIE